MSVPSSASLIESPAVHLHPDAIPHALLLFFLTFALSFLYHRYSALALHYLTSTASSRSALSSISSRLSSLRAQSAQLNSPSTFAQHAKLERQIAVLSKQREQLVQQSSSASATSLSPLAARVILYLPAAVSVAAVCYCWWDVTVVMVTAASWLRLTPLRLLLGDIGVLRWLLISYRVSRMLNS
jgi:hypothetical protein